MTDAVIKALGERLDRLHARRAAPSPKRAQRLLAHGEAFAALPIVDSRSLEEIFGYNEVGLPR